MHVRETDRLKTDERFVRADWVWTRFGRMVHLARDAKTTRCGLVAHENADAPWCYWAGRACSACVRSFINEHAPSAPYAEEAQ